MTIRMGYWDCPSCGAKSVEGVLHNCPACGRPRGPGVAFYTNDSAARVDDPELVARARAGADWQCRFCGADNRAGAVDCQRCGASADGTRRREQRMVGAPAEATPGATKPRGGSKAAFAVLAALAVLLVGGWFFFLRTKPLTVTLQAITWAKSIQVEELRTEREEGWKDEVPSAARELSRTTKMREREVEEGTTRVKVGTKDLGNGMFEDVYEEQPKRVTKRVQDTWVSYEIERWKRGPTLERTTSDGTEPPEPPFAPGPRQRIASREHELRLELEGSDAKRYTFEVDLAAERSPKERAVGFKKGAAYPAQINGLGAVMALAP